LFMFWPSKFLSLKMNWVWVYLLKFLNP